MPVPHSRHTLCANAGFFASIQQNTGFCRSSSQHGLVSGKVGVAVAGLVGEEVGVAVGGLVGEEVGAMVGQVLPRLVPPMPSVYDVPTEPTLTRGPHSPALLYTQLDHPHSHHLSATHGHEHLK